MKRRPTRRFAAEAISSWWIPEAWRICAGAARSWKHREKERLELAFAGGVRLTDIPELADEGIDILCIGKEIVDAQLLDMRLDVIQEES